MTLAGSLTILCLGFSTLQAGGQASILFSACSLQTCRPECYSHSCGSPGLSGQPERSVVLGRRGPGTPFGAGGFPEGALSSRARNRGGPGSGDWEEGVEGPRTPCSGAPGAERVGQRALRSAAEQAEESHATPPRATVRRGARRRVGVLRTSSVWRSFLETLQPNAAGTRG